MKDNYLNSTKRTVEIPAIVKVQLPDEPEVKKVEVINQIQPKEFPEVQKVEVTNQPEIITEKVEVKVEKVEFPDVQKVEITNQPDKLEFIKAEITNPTVFPDTTIIKNLPLGDGNKVGSDPERYIVVRITDGEHFVRPTDKISAGSGGGVGSTIGNKVLTGQVTIAGTTVLGQDVGVMNGVIIEGLSTNTGNVYIGGAGVTIHTGFELQPGQSTSVAINNLNKIYVAGANGDKICFITSQ